MTVARLYALAYAARGFHVLPCQPRGKLPLTEHGHHDATTDTATIAQWWTNTPTANIGIACAASGVVVIDIDRHGADGFTTMKSLLAELGSLPETVAAVTGGGGRHLIFQAPAGTAFRGELGTGVDVKHQGHILIAPSVHPSGGDYHWLCSPLGREPSALPQTWLTRMRRAVATPVICRPPIVCATGRGTRYGCSAADREIERVRTSVEGARHVVLNSAAWKLGSLFAGGELGDVQEDLVAAAMSAGLPDYEARATTADGWRAGLRNPRTAPTRERRPMPSNESRKP